MLKPEAPPSLRHARPARYCLLTNDVETHSIWHNELRDETGAKVVSEGMPILLDLYAELGVLSTFYFTGYIAKLFPEVVRMILPYGHEVGCHGKSHRVENGFDVMPLEKQERHLRDAKALLEDIAGQSVISFRAPALRVNDDTARALAATGFRIDSSVASQRFDMFLSFGSAGKLRWLTAPRTPYRTDPDSLFRRGVGPLVEVPLSAAGLPYVGTTMRVVPGPTRMLRRFLGVEARRTGKPIVFDIHPNEFIEEQTTAPRVLARRTANTVSYLVRDLIRGHLKVRNLGHAAIPLYRREIEYFRDSGYLFASVQQYCKETGLL